MKDGGVRPRRLCAAEGGAGSGPHGTISCRCAPCGGLRRAPAGTAKGSRTLDDNTAPMAVYGRQGPVLSATRPRAAANAAFQTDPPMAACSRGVPCSQARISTAKSFQTQHTPHHPYIAHEIYKFYESNNTQARDHTHIITYYYLYVMMMYYDDDVSNTLCPAR